MARMGQGWKEAGCDTSPPRPEPTAKAKLEIQYGERLAAIRRWESEGRLTYHAETDLWITVHGVAYDPRALLDDVTFANIALGAQAGGGSNG